LKPVQVLTLVGGRHLQLLWPILCSFGRPQAPQVATCRSCHNCWSSIRRQWFNLAEQPNKRQLRELKETATAADDDRIVGPNPRATYNLQLQQQQQRQRQQKQMCLYIVTKLTLITRSPGLCGKRKYAKQLVAATPATSSNSSS